MPDLKFSWDSSEIMVQGQSVDGGQGSIQPSSGPRPSFVEMQLLGKTRGGQSVGMPFTIKLAASGAKDFTISPKAESIEILSVTGDGSTDDINDDDWAHENLYWSVAAINLDVYEKPGGPKYAGPFLLKFESGKTQSHYKTKGKPLSVGISVVLTPKVGW